MSTLDLLGIVGSLRTGSRNAALARSATAAVPTGATLDLHDVADVPLYNGDHEVSGPPAGVARLYDAVEACDGLLFFSPEYNSSFPAVTKNVIDWLSRKPSTWNGTAVTMLTLSPGGRAGRGVREQFTALMTRQAARPFETFGVGRSGDIVGAADPSGGDGGVVEVTDPSTIGELRGFLERFADFSRTLPAPD